MSAPKRTCGTCRHFRSGDNGVRHACVAPVPNCVDAGERYSVERRDDATNCPCYEPKTLIASIGRNEKPEVE